MFDVGSSELLVIAVVAILVIGPKDMPLALRTAGRWIGKMRRISAHFRSGLDAMIREAEMEDMDRKWREQNEAIMAKYPADQMTPLEAPVHSDASAESAVVVADPKPDASGDIDESSFADNAVDKTAASPDMSTDADSRDS